jgi:hypothetical protein
MQSNAGKSVFQSVREFLRETSPRGMISLAEFFFFATAPLLGILSEGKEPLLGTDALSSEHRGTRR